MEQKAGIIDGLLIKIYTKNTKLKLELKESMNVWLSLNSIS